MRELAQRFDAIVLGAGAAGLFCASQAAARGRRVCVLERAAEPGKKILISGGGRCNFTNAGCAPENFLSSNPHFAKSALARYTPADFVTMVEKHRIPYHEKKLGQLFCDRSARDIVRMLLDECPPGQADVILRCDVREIRKTTEYLVETSAGTFAAPALVVATGGLSIPKMGATAFGYEAATQFGLRLVPTRPALVPLLFNDADRAAWQGLAGISTGIVAAFGGVSFREKMLFTHRGLSGPAILQISSYWDGAGAITIDLLPTIAFEAAVDQSRREGDRSSLKTLLASHLPKRLAERWLEQRGETTVPALEQALHNWRVMPSGTEGYEKAEVTAGGVHPDELSSRTMEARRVPGLFFIGEVVDVTGQLGGHNFQWAWASAFAAAQAL